MKKKRFTIIISAVGLMIAFALASITLHAQSANDSLQPQVTNLKDKVAGVEDRITNAEADLAKLTKIKFSGYIQAQWQHFENPSIYPSNYFSIRRARLKVQYEPASGVDFVLQPDFQPGNFVIKEAYARLNEPWLKIFSLWGGKFSRPNYEVEYSSSDLDVLERSRIITTLYPGEYAVGAKLEVTPAKIPLKFQLALLNGNDGLTINDINKNNLNSKDNTDFDNPKDIMARLTYGFKFGRWGGLTIGAHAYIGAIKATTDTVLKSDYTKDKYIKVGQSLTKNWFGFEAQFYADVLGGLVLKGEYIMGTNAYPGASGTTSTTTDGTFSSLNATKDTLSMLTYQTVKNGYIPNIIRDFSGGYIYLIKNITKKFQFAARYDFYDPNTKLSGNQIGVVNYNDKIATKTSTSKPAYTKDGSVVIKSTTQTTTSTSSTLTSGSADIAYSTVDLALHYYFDSNIKISLEYQIPMNEKVGTNSKGAGNITSGYTVNNIPGTLDYSKVFPQNALTLRLQVKF